MTSASSVREAGDRPVLCDSPEGWGGRQVGEGVQAGGTHVYYGRLMLMCGKSHHNIVR